MARRIDYGRIAVILSVIIFLIFAADFIRRAYHDWRGQNGQLIVQTNSSIDPYGTSLPPTTPDHQTSTTTTTTTTSNPDENLPKLTLLGSEVYTGSLVLVNETLHWQGQSALVAFSELNYANFRLPTRSLQISKSMSNDLIRMFNDFYAATSLGNVMIYATTETPKAAAYQVSMPERASGLSIDLALWDETSGTHSPYQPNGNYGWLQSHCAEYGFVQRYTAEKTEQTGVEQQVWHYRYVGIPHAQYMTQQNLCLEEYLELLRTAHGADAPLSITANNGNYTVYYVPAAEGGGMTEVTVPKNLPITVSGDNQGGYIICIQNANS